MRTSPARQNGPAADRTAPGFGLHGNPERGAADDSLPDLTAHWSADDPAGADLLASVVRATSPIPHDRALTVVRRQPATALPASQPREVRRLPGRRAPANSRLSATLVLLAFFLALLAVALPSHRAGRSEMPRPAPRTASSAFERGTAPLEPEAPLIEQLMTSEFAGQQGQTSPPQALPDAALPAEVKPSASDRGDADRPSAADAAASKAGPTSDPPPAEPQGAEHVANSPDRSAQGEPANPAASLEQPAEGNSGPAAASALSEPVAVADERMKVTPPRRRERAFAARPEAPERGPEIILPTAPPAPLWWGEPDAEFASVEPPQRPAPTAAAPHTENKQPLIVVQIEPPAPVSWSGTAVELASVEPPQPRSTKTAAPLIANKQPAIVVPIAPPAPLWWSEPRVKLASAEPLIQNEQPAIIVPIARPAPLWWGEPTVKLAAVEWRKPRATGAIPRNSGNRQPEIVIPIAPPAPLWWSEPPVKLASAKPPESRATKAAAPHIQNEQPAIVVPIAPPAPVSWDAPAVKLAPPLAILIAPTPEPRSDGGQTSGRPTPPTSGQTAALASLDPKRSSPAREPSSREPLLIPGARSASRQSVPPPPLNSSPQSAEKPTAASASDSALAANGLSPKPSTAGPEDAWLLNRARGLLKLRDIVGARLLLESALDRGNAEAAFMLAETYDPKLLASWGARGVRGDPARAQELYAQARRDGFEPNRDRPGPRSQP